MAPHAQVLEALRKTLEIKVPPGPRQQPGAAARGSRLALAWAPACIQCCAGTWG